MSYDDLLTACRAQTAIMLLDYHLAVSGLLDDLVTKLPPSCPDASAVCHDVIGDFQAEVKALALRWSRT